MRSKALRSQRLRGWAQGVSSRHSWTTEPVGQKAIEELATFEDLSDEVQKLVARIYEFVVKQNT